MLCVVVPVHKWDQGNSYVYIVHLRLLEMTKYAGAVIIRVHVDLFGYMYCSMNEKTYIDM